MLKNWALIVCMAMLSASCNSILNSKPLGTLSEQQMVDVLVDIHLTEATLKIANDSLARVSDTAELRNRFAQVFRKHDIEPDDFNASLNYYLEHIEQIDKIYTEVINRLTLLEAALAPKTNLESDRNRLNTGMYNINNPWFKSLNKKSGPEEIRYFDEVKYPVASTRKVYYPEPYHKVLP
jgi:hypothetical protein